MDLETSDLIAAVVDAEEWPVPVTGYLWVEEEPSVRVYPELDARFYYKFADSCVIASDGVDDGRTTVLLEADCDVDVVSHERLSASELNRAGRSSGMWYPCGKRPGGGPEGGFVYSRKDELRQWLIDYARMMVDAGISSGDINCRSLDSMSAGCCRAIKRLIDAAESGSGEWGAAQSVMAHCHSLG